MSGGGEPGRDGRDARVELCEAPCPACRGDRHRPLFSVEAEPPAPRGPWRFVRCLGCESEYLRPRPARPLELYGEGYHVHRLPGRLGRLALKVAARGEVIRLKHLVPRGGRVFEIGCGTGTTLAAFRARGFEASGLEPSPLAVKAARVQRLDVAEGVFEPGRGVSGHYDLVLAAHVLEHVEDPLSFLEQIRRILKPGGRALVKTPVAGSWDAELLGGFSGKYDVPYHLLVPSVRALRALAAEAGLEVRKVTADSVPNDYVHGIRKMARIEAGLPLRFIRPTNPVFALPLWPLSWLAASAGAAGRARVVLERVGV